MFEALQRLGDEPLDVCRRCGGSARRIISSPAIRFVGSGWYVTDYAKKGEAKKDGRPARDGPSGPKPDAAGEDSGKDPAGTTASPSSRSGGPKTSAAAGEARVGSPS